MTPISTPRASTSATSDAHDPTRRRFLTLLPSLSIGGLALLAGCGPGMSSGQQPTRPTRIGFLSSGPTGPSPLVDPFLDGLRELGYVDGRNVAIEYRFADGRPHALYELAHELVRLPVEVIVAASSEAAVAAKTATTTIPIVAVAMTGDPGGGNLARSLERPSDNVTGVTAALADHSSRQLALLGEVLPNVSRVAYLWNGKRRGGPGTNLHAEIEATARAPGIQLHSLEIKAAEQLGPALDSAAQRRVQGLVVLGDPLTFLHRARIVDFAARERLPAVYDFREFVDAGGLLGYGPSMGLLYRRSAAYVDKLIRGSQPADLPVERPATTQLIVNLNTARTLGLTIPQSVLDRATEVIG